MRIDGGRQEAQLYRYRFGAAEFDEVKLELRVNGVCVEIEQKPLQVLTKLLRSVNEVITRQEILDDVWDGRPTVEHVLNNAVSKLRTALGDTDANLLVTVPRVGYKLVSQVEKMAVGRRLASQLALVAGQQVLGRTDSVLQAQLSAPAANEIWLAVNPKTGEKSVFKFCVEGEHLTALKREATLHRFLRESVGDRDDFVRIIEWNFETPPFYLQLEYAGENLFDWSNRDGRLRALSLEQRVELFLQIADAIAAAHGVGVLHKDIKPTNVLVMLHAAGGWQTRIADFGSGRMLEPGRLEALGITKLGMTVTQNISADSASGTPLYFAPELLTGNAPTVQSDLFSLGLLLYQLCVGDLRRPMASGWECDIHDSLLCADIAAATAGDPKRRLTSVTELTNRLRNRDARRKEQTQLAMAEQRAQAAERQLALARTRRPWLIAAATSLTVGLLISLWLYRGESIARGKAERAEARTEAINHFLNDDLLAAGDSSGPGSTHDTTIQQVLARASGRLEQRFSNDLATKASIELALGNAYFGISDYAAAEPRLRRAVDLLRATNGIDDEATLDAQYALATNLMASNKLKEAELLINATDSNAGDRLTKSSRLALRGHWVRANFFKFQYRADKALVEFAAADKARLIVDPDNRYLLFRIKDGLSWSYLRLDRNSDAERVLRDLMVPAFTPDDIGPLYWSQARLDYGLALNNLSRHEEAEAVTLIALKELQTSLGGDHYFTALAQNQLGDLYVGQDKLAEAAEPYRQCYEIFRRRVGEHAQATLVALANLGILETRLGQLSSARSKLGSAHTEFAQTLGNVNPLSQITAYYLASALIDSSHAADGMALLTDLDAAALAAAEPGNDWDQRVRGLKGKALLQQGHKTEALSMLAPSVANMQRDKLPAAIVLPFEKALAAASRP